MQAKIRFGSKYILIELLESPITDLWLESVSSWNAQNVPMKFVEVWSSYTKENVFHGPPEEIVSKINNCIDILNDLTTGEKITDRAYIDMPWSQTNRLHRIFTTSSTNHFNWKHNLSANKLIEGKKHSYYNKRDYLIEHSSKTMNFPINEINPDAKEAFRALYSLNKWIHFFEDQRVSYRAVNSVKHLGGSAFREIEWDCYNDSGQKLPTLIKDTTTYEDIVKTFKNPKAKDCDVHISKAITGKDYETSFLQYDDPLEFDTTNVDHITGGIKLFNTEYYKRLYGDKSDLMKWGLDSGLEEEMIKPLPLGKIISRNTDFSDYQYSKTVKYSTGTPAPEGDYYRPVIEII